jgi:hypothetical protein
MKRMPRRETGLVSLPREIRPGFSGTTRFRFLNSTGGQTISPLVAMGSVAFVGLTTTTARSMFSAVRIRQIELWSSPSSTPNSLLAEFTSTQSTDQPGNSADIHSAISIGGTFPGHLRIVPKRNEAAGLWIPLTDSSNDSQLLLNVPANTIADITLDWRIDFTTTSSISLTGTGWGAGELVYGPFDAITALSSSKWTPQGVDAHIP